MASAKLVSPMNLSATELELKRRGRRRLIGALTLGLLAIVFLPMIFDSEPKKNPIGTQEIAIQVPPKEGLAPLTAPVMAPTASTAVQTATATTKIPATTVPVAPPETVQGLKLETKVAPRVETKPAPVATPAAKSGSAAAVKSGFVIQIGAFKDAANAQQIATQMKAAKLPVFTDSVATSGGSVTRVRVGPFASRQKADSALAEVKLAGADGKIVPLN